MPTRSSAAPPSRTSRAGSQPCSDTERPASSSLAFPVRTDHAVRRTTWDCRKGAGWVSICQSHVVRPSPPPLSPRNGAAAPPLCRRNVLEDVLQRLQRHKRHDPPRAPPAPAPRAATELGPARRAPPPWPAATSSVLLSLPHSCRASASSAVASSVLSLPQPPCFRLLRVAAAGRTTGRHHHPRPPPIRSRAAAAADGRRPRRRPASARLHAQRQQRCLRHRSHRKPRSDAAHAPARRSRRCATGPSCDVMRIGRAPTFPALSAAARLPFDVRPLARAQPSAPPHTASKLPWSALVHVHRPAPRVPSPPLAPRLVASTTACHLGTRTARRRQRSPSFPFSIARLTSRPLPQRRQSSLHLHPTPPPTDAHNRLRS